MPTIIQSIPEQKRVSISSKRQFTIPQKYYTELGFDKEAICIKGKDYLIIRPSASASDGAFAEQILADLISEGFTGTKLLNEFKARQSNVRLAVEKMLDEANRIAQGIGEYETYEDVFGTEDESP